MAATESDIYTGDVGFDAIIVLSVLTSGYYGIDVIADEAGLTISRTFAALCLLLASGKASKHPLFGYALHGSPTRS